MWDKKNITITLVVMLVLGVLLTRWSIPLPLSITLIPDKPSEPGTMCTMALTYRAVFGWPFTILFVSGRNGCDASLLFSVLSLILNFLIYLKISSLIFKLRHR